MSQELTRRAALTGLAGGAAAATLAPVRRARAADAPVLRLGVLTDLSGPYADVSGSGSVICAQQAAAEAMAAHPGMKVEIVSGDHQNKPDVGASIAREWFDRGGVDAILDVPNSGVGLAVASVCREKDKVFLVTGAATDQLTGSKCSPNTVHWTFDTYMLARVTGGALVEQGLKNWFFLVADYVFGHVLEKDATALIDAAHGKVVGSVAYPFPGTADFSSYLVQAQSSGAQVLGLGNAGHDTVNCIKQAHEFGLNKTMTIAAMLMFITSVHSLGLETAQGLVLSESFYWDLNDRTRAFSDRMLKRRANWRPNMEQAGTYAATIHYCKVAAAMGVAAAKQSGAKTVVQMKVMPTDDDAFGKGYIRADGRKIQPAYLFRVKKPSESKGEWDLYNVVATIPPDQASRPVAEGHCSIVHA